MSTVHQVYQRTIGNSPVDHQQKGWDLLSQGRSVLIRAPTGSGKTEAVILPYIIHAGEKLPFRLIYALPLRSLANQVKSRIEKYAAALGKPPSWRCRLQHGDAPESVLFLADAVVATIDQVITSYACSPLTLPVRHGNIPAGAVASSFLVFDEAHLFDPELGLQATRLICERLCLVGIPYAVLSATLPDSVVEFWERNLGAQPIEADSEFVQREVMVEWQGALLTADKIKGALGWSDRILVVCNTVERAVQLYRQLANEARTQGYACAVFHSRFLPNDRELREKWVVERFGQHASETGRVLLIATQVVEVGLDISAELLLSEVAPVDALIQRAGRVARWGGKGRVWVYDVDAAAPYEHELVNRTREVLKAECESGGVLDWVTAKRWVNRVFNDPYRRVLYENKVYEQVVAQLSRAAFEGSRRRAEAAVRDVNTVEVTVHRNPDGLGNDVLHLPTIGVHIGVAREWVRHAAQSKIDVLRVEVDRVPSDAQVSVSLRPISEKELVIGDRLVFPPAVIRYSDEVGLELGTGSEDFPVRSASTRLTPPSALRAESWIQHSVRVAQSIRSILEKERHAVTALARIYKVTEEQIEEAAQLGAILHDLGKLNRGWQEKAGVHASADPEELLAHTDGRNYGRFPPHAAVGAYALWPVLVDDSPLPRMLAKALCFAIAHHHSVRAKEVPRYEFHPNWRQAVELAMGQCGARSHKLDLARITAEQRSSTNLRGQFPQLENPSLYTAYVLLSRWLRLADRIATGGEHAVLHYEDWFGRL